MDNIKEKDFSKISGITVEFYNWIISNIKLGSTILELGSGDASTQYLCEKYVLFSIENDKAFCGKYKSNYIYAPLKDGWYDVEIVKKEIPKKYDLIIVDGPRGPIARMGFYKHLDIFDVSVPIIIDDIIYKNMELINELKKKTGKTIKIFDTKAKGKNTFAVLL